MEESFRKYIEEIVREIMLEHFGEFKSQIAQVGALVASMKNPDPLLSYKEISIEFKISVRSIAKLKASGLLLPEAKGGREFLFKRSDVINALQKRPRSKPKFLR